MGVKKNITYCFIMLLCIPLQANEAVQNQKIEVGIDEQLDSYIPMDLEFKNADGEPVKLGDIIDRPVLLSLVYYECPGICNPLLTELAATIDKVELAPYEDFKMLSISFDHRETPKIAKRWKKNYLAAINREFPNDSWNFLTGDSVTIKKLTDAVGFYFKRDGDDFSHAGSVIAISPEGKITRYIFGTTFNQFDLKMALIDAEAGKSNPTIAKVLQFCFSYDREGRTYTLNITRIIGTVMLLAVGVFLSVLVFKKKKDKSKKVDV
jgi:protein SCO1/2